MQQVQEEDDKRKNAHNSEKRNLKIVLNKNETNSFC
jgi:hypothetical protein